MPINIPSDIFNGNHFSYSKIGNNVSNLATSLFWDFFFWKKTWELHSSGVSFSSGQQNLMKTYHNEADIGGITKITSKNFLELDLETSFCDQYC